MKPITLKAFFLIWITGLVVVSGPISAQVYKTVDKDGNITFTDQPPADGSQPMELKQLSVIEAPVYEQAPKKPEEGTGGDADKQMSLGYLRKNYADFAIVAPQPEESVWQPEHAVTVAWNVRYALQRGMQVTVSVDGQQQPPTTSQIIPISKLDRGEHSVTAELKDAQNRVIATAKPVTFYIRQPNLYSNRPGG